MRDRLRAAHSADPRRRADACVNAPRPPRAVVEERAARWVRGMPGVQDDAGGRNSQGQALREALDSTAMQDVASIDGSGAPQTAQGGESHRTLRRRDAFDVVCGGAGDPLFDPELMDEAIVTGGQRMFNEREVDTSARDWLAGFVLVGGGAGDRK